MSKICFLVGHGTADDGKTYDSGATYKGYHEFKIAKEIAKFAQEYYNSTYTEHADLMNYKGDLSLQERINKCKDDTYNFIAEIHLNAGGGTGTECYFYHNSDTCKKYAQAITKNIALTFDVKNRGAKTKLNKNGDDYFGIIRSTKPTAVLVETLFIDTDADLNKIKTPEGQKKCGVAIAKAVASVRGAKKKPAPSSPTSKDITLNGFIRVIAKNGVNYFTEPKSNAKVAGKASRYYIFTIVAENGDYYKNKNGYYFKKDKTAIKFAKSKQAL